MTSVEWPHLVLAAVLVMWVLLTALSQVYSTQWRILAKLQWILPGWTFFAPTPPDSDAVLLHRDIDEMGNSTHWKAHRLFKERTWYHCFWRPDRRNAKAFFDIYLELNQRVTQGESRDFVVVSVAYIALLSDISLIARPNHAQKTQFAILAITPDDPNGGGIVFLSNVHHL